MTIDEIIHEEVEDIKNRFNIYEPAGKILEVLHEIETSIREIYSLMTKRGNEERLAPEEKSLIGIFDLGDHWKNVKFLDEEIRRKNKKKERAINKL
jgi:hypothetical protein